MKAQVTLTRKSRMLTPIPESTLPMLFGIILSSFFKQPLVLLLFLTLFRMGFFGAADERRGLKSPTHSLPKMCHTYLTMGVGKSQIRDSMFSNGALGVTYFVMNGCGKISDKGFDT